MNRNRLTMACVLLALCALGSPVLAGTKGSGVTIPVTAEFRDYCFTWVSSRDVPCSSWDRIGSDSNGTWPFPYTHGIDGVAATINAAGEFELDTSTSSGRMYRALFVDFGLAAIDNPTPISPFPMFTYAFVDAYMTTYGGALATMQYGDSAHAIGLIVNFPGWSVRFGLDAGTVPVQATCTGPAQGGACNMWVIEASVNDVAKLLKVSRKGQTEDYGNFYLPFRVTVNKLVK